MGLTFQIRHLIGKYIDFMKCLKSHKGDRSMAFQEIKGSYMNFAKKDLCLFLIALYEWQKKNALDPYLIIGIFTPSRQTCIEPSFDF